MQNTNRTCARIAFQGNTLSVVGIHICASGLGTVPRVFAQVPFPQTGTGGNSWRIDWICIAQDGRVCEFGVLSWKLGRIVIVLSF